MKKILLILSLFPILVFSQKSYKIPADSTILNNIGSGKNELVIRNATSNITGGVLTNLGNGVTAFVLGGGSARVVDTIYKNNTKDSIVFTISGIRYSVKDSIGVTDLSGYALQSSLNDTASTLRRIRKVDSSYLFKNATRDSICMVTVINGSTYRTCAFDSSIVNTDAQTLTAGVNTLTISGGNTVDLNRKVDTSYSFRNTSLDSICQIVIINGNPTRSCIKDSTGGGGASLSGLTAATATNNIFNTNYKQRWNWNTIAGDTALVIASNSVNAASNTQTLFSVFQSGANAASTQTTYSGIFSNTKTGTTSTNIGARFLASGANNNYAIEAESQVKILNASTGTRYLSFWSGTTENASIGNLNAFGALASDNLDLSVNNGMAIVFRTTAGTGVGSEKVRIRNSGALCVNTTGSDSYALHIQKGSFSDAAYISTGNLVMEGGSAVKFNWTNQLLFSHSNGVSMTDNTHSKVFTVTQSGNIGIGTFTPNSSARLDIQSTVQGFLPPRLTTAQRDAIATPATGLTLFCTDCTATDASTGVMQTYNGTTWKNFW